MFNKIVSWVVLSSKNPASVSLTFKGAILAAIAFITHFIPTEGLVPLAESVTLLVQQVLSVVATLMIVWGAVRKIYRTAAGKNEVLNGQIDE